MGPSLAPGAICQRYPRWQERHFLVRSSAQVAAPLPWHPPSPAACHLQPLYFLQVSCFTPRKGFRYPRVIHGVSAEDYGFLSRIYLIQTAVSLNDDKWKGRRKLGMAAYKLHRPTAIFACNPKIVTGSIDC
ncbi:unnamed protein product [Victoria cruziana]